MMSGPEAAGGGRRCPGEIAGALLIVVLTSLAYVPAIRGGYIWDDREYVWANDALRSLEGLRQLWLAPMVGLYSPLTVTTFWLEYHVWGVAPLGYHVTNVALHIVDALLVWALLRRLAIGGALFAAGIFALHPVHVESVAWIAERKDVLSAFFSLLTLLVWIRFVERGGWRSYALASALFVCALLSKAVACTLPLVLLLLAWWKGWRWNLAYVMPLLLVSLGFGILTVSFEQAAAPVPSFPLVERVLVAGRAAWFYAEKLLWPVHLMTMYPHWDVDAGTSWQYGFPAAALAVVGALWWLRARIGKAPLVALLFFLITLAPVLGFVPAAYLKVYYVADHLQYFASIGPIALFAGVLAHVAHRLAIRPVWRTALAAPLVLALAELSWQQGRFYRDAETLWRHAVASNPDAWDAEYNLGTLLMEQGKLGEAIPHLEATIRLNPEWFRAQTNLGIILARQGKFDEAARLFAEAVRLQPHSADGERSWGLVLAMQGKPDEAIAHLNRALDIDPRHLAAHYDLGLLLEAQDKLDAAISHYAAATQIDPQRADLTAELQRALAKRQALQERAGQ